MDHQSIAALKIRLSLLTFLVFASWGAYLTSMGNYLGNAGMGDLIPWFFALQGVVCLFMPALIGFLADKYVEPLRLLGICHLGSCLFIGMCWYMGCTSPHPDRTLFVSCYALSTALFMPTIALTNSISFKLLRKNGLDTVRHFPSIRMFGTIGFVLAMLFVNFAYIPEDGFIGFSSHGMNRFQFNQWQFMVSACVSLLLFLFTFTLPRIPLERSMMNKSLWSRLGLDAFSIFRDCNMVVFFIFSALVGMCLKVTNAYAAPFITSFLGDPTYAMDFGAANANLLNSISQVSEALCILLVPFFMKRYGIKPVFTIAIVAWALRFATFAIGNPGDGLWLLVLSMIIYGIGFDFYNVSGAIFIESATDKKLTASAQGLWMMTTMGIGTSIGSLLAGWVVNTHCHWQMSQTAKGTSYLMGDWPLVWSICSLFAIVTAVGFLVCFKNVHRPSAKAQEDAQAIEEKIDEAGLVYEEGK